MIDIKGISEDIYILNPKISIKNSKYGLVIHGGQRTYVLNEIGGLIINMIITGNNKNQIIRDICKMYEVSQYEVNKDFDLFVHKMIVDKIIEYIPNDYGDACIYGTYASYGSSKMTSINSYKNVLLVKADTNIDNNLFGKYDFIIINGGNMMSEAAIRARQHMVACLIVTHGSVEALKSIDSITLDYKSNKVQLKSTSIIIKPVQEATYLDIENINPYDIRDINNILRVGVLRFLEDPLCYVLLKLTEENVIIYSHNDCIIDKTILIKLGKFFGKRVVLGSTDIYENYTSILYGIYTDDNFREIYKTIVFGNPTINKIVELSNYCIQMSIKRLDDAEKIIEFISTSSNDSLENILFAFRAINDSAIYFIFSNEVFPSYGLRFLLTKFKELKLNRVIDFVEFISAIDTGNCDSVYSKISSDINEVSELIKNYTYLVNCKKTTTLGNQYDKRSQLWSKTAKAFRIKTNHKPSEFLGQHGSGYRFESYLLLILGWNSGNLWDKLYQISKLPVDIQ